MRLFANPRCRTLMICGTLLIFGAVPSELQAQDAQAQGSFRSDIALFDEFLETRAGLDAQLRANPSLLTNDEFLENHPQLQNFLTQHPNLRARIDQNPSEFFKEREDFHTARTNRGAPNPNPDLTRQQVADMDRFLDNNPQIDRDLRRNPSLVTNADYLQDHPALQSFLNQHPEMKEEIAENPRNFMQREGRFDSQESARARANANADANVNANPDLTRQQVADMDRFLDNNPQIDRDLRRNPSLVTNADYLQDHPALQTFLNQHPEMKQEIAENPRDFMQREGRFDTQESARARANANAGANVNANPDLTRQQVADMDRFLDNNPQIDRDLRNNPSLLASADYQQDHPALQNFLNQHPEMKEEIAENPRDFMQREGRFDAQESARARANANVNANPDLTRQQVADMDRFLDNNPQIDRDLRRNPSLVTNADYLQDHPALRTFLNQHPEMKEEIAENPRNFIQREGRFDAQESARARANANVNANTNFDLTQQEVATMGNFLDHHPDLAKSLEKKPNLINNKGFLKHHRDLDEFLSEHPAVREEVRENPSFFMNREQQFEARNMDRDRALADRDRDVRVDRDRDSTAGDVDTGLDRKELKDMDRFLDKHKGIEKDLRKKPELVNDRDYLKHHKSLGAFLEKNPRVGDELREDPARFMRDQERFERQNHRMNNRVDMKTKTNEKSKTDEKEKMSTPIPH